MTGYHEVKAFEVRDRELLDGLPLAEGWKPFAFQIENGKGYVICRKWHRKGQTLADMQAEVDAA